MWIELHRREPIDDSRADFHAAIIASTIANYAGMQRKEGAPPVTPLDYMPFQKPPEPAVVNEPDPMEFFGRMS